MKNTKEIISGVVVGILFIGLIWCACFITQDDVISARSQNEIQQSN